MLIRLGGSVQFRVCIYNKRTITRSDYTPPHSSLATVPDREKVIVGKLMI